MFNGLIREFGTVKSFDKNRLKIKADLRPNLGDSIAINGACLSVISLFDGGFEVELSSASADILALENYKNRVHIEPAMRLDSRIDGHLVQGHIDAVGKIIDIKKRAVGADFFIKVPTNIAKFISPKGSIAIDGVSLTVGDINGDLMQITIIPLTLKDTLFGEFKIGRRVNIETDMMARYAHRILSASAFNGEAKNANGLSHEEAEFYAAIY